MFDPLWTVAEIKRLLFEAAVELLRVHGPELDQRAVLRKIAKQLHAVGDLKAEQLILTSWYDLFRDGKLCWGFNVENPGPPWLHHVPDRERNT